MFMTGVLCTVCGAQVYFSVYCYSRRSFYFTLFYIQNTCCILLYYLSRLIVIEQCSRFTYMYCIMWNNYIYDKYCHVRCKCYTQFYRRLYI